MDKTEQYINKFLDYLTDIKRYSPNTIRAYKQDILQLYVYLEEHGCSIDDRDSLRGFISFVFMKTHNKLTVSRKIYALKAYFSFLIRNNVIKNNPAEQIVLPKEQRRLPSVLSLDEMKLFLDSFPSANAIDLRDRTIFELLYASGIRISELTSLNVQQVHFASGLIRVVGKGKKERIIPVHPNALRLVKEYLQSRNAQTSLSEDALFVNQRGTRLSARSIERILVKRFRQITDSGKHVYPHLFRHSFATHLLQKGANLRIIQELLGHNHLSTTQKYTSLNFSDLLKSYKQFHPGETKD